MTNVVPFKNRHLELIKEAQKAFDDVMYGSSDGEPDPKLDRFVQINNREYHALLAMRRVIFSGKD